MAVGGAVVVEHRGPVTWIRLNRPERCNALTYPLLEELLEVCEEAADDPSARVVVLTGTGPAFCAGGDIHHLLEDNRNRLTEAEQRDRLIRLHRISWLLHAMEKPTIAAINGTAAAAGLSLALACDFRVMSATATLASAFSRLGVPGDFGGTWFAVRLLGLARAKELYLLDEPITAEQALRLGLVTAVAAPESLAVDAGALAERLARGPATALGLMKANFAASLTEPLGEFLDTEATNMILGMSTKEFEAAARAFVEGRGPGCTGR